MSKPLLPPEYELRMVTCVGNTEPSLWLLHMGQLSEGGVPEEELIHRAWEQFRSELSNERLHKLLQLEAKLAEAHKAHLRTVGRIRTRFDMHTMSYEATSKAEKGSVGRQTMSAEYGAAMSFRLVLEHVEREDLGHIPVAAGRSSDPPV